MGKHGTDKQANKLALYLIKQGRVEDAKKVIASTSLKNQQAITDRIVKGLQIGQGRH